MESKFNYKNFSIVIPIYNEEEILEESTNTIFSICKRIGIDFEIIFSENGSTDNTKKIANELKVGEKDVVEMNRRLSGPEKSLNAPISDDDATERINLLESREENQEKKLNKIDENAKRKELLLKALDGLNDREKNIFS